MVRISKQTEKRSKYPRKNKKASIKTGSLKDKLAKGYREHDNAVEGDFAKEVFIPKIK